MLSSIFSLKHKDIAITGGYGYLGKAISEGLAEAGGTVFVLGRDEDKFKESFLNPGNIFFQTCDIRDTNSIRNAFKSITDKAEKIDCLINNAFYSKGSDPENLTDEEWNYGIDGSLNSVYRCIREIIPHFKEKQAGKIINVSSMYGLVSPDFSIYEAAPNALNPPHYGAAKAGVVQLTKYFACYLGKYNVQVNAVTPGPFPGETTQQNEAFIQNLKAKNPLGRIGKPEDLQGAFILLSSNASDYITGHNLVVDGGWTAW
jgi:NAD(P)-dependent dehydrogenase (short-subunit alcohol dehydrogenase family)